MEEKKTFEPAKEFEGVIRAYVTNLSKYNEGILVGQWVDFPTNAEKMQEVFQNIGIDNVRYEEVFITDVESDIKGMNNIVQEYTSLNEVNYLAGQIQQLEPLERQIYEIVSQEYVYNIETAIDLTQGLDSFICYEDVSNEYELGRYYVEEAGIYDTSNMGNLVNYIDYEQLGQDICLDEQGCFIENNYILQTEEMPEVYANLEIPQEYKIDTRTEITPKEESINVILVEPNKEAKEITIPNKLEKFQEVVGGLIADCSPHEDIGMIINDEGKMMGLDLNRALVDFNGNVQDIVAGNMIIAGVDKVRNYASLTPEQKAKHMEQFKYPEIFIEQNGEIKAMKVPELPEKKEQTKQQEKQNQMKKDNHER